ncbi:MAG: signal peptidase II [Candidatus Cloacimonetes bacterium]|jgi:signal peptidase II|nr:signal peptidase II [Candidatus Cloacimonadota bacterium]MCK9584482.1 signal peptidase II [Candidatus Cloacimonadota bacterium]MDY0229025.1 signal peptidase II [Candidatus Cloacimonadaceae bacterium]
MKTKLKIAPAYLIMMIVVLADQITKLLVRLNIELYHSVPVLADLFGETFLFTHVNNTGAAFSIGFSSDLTNRVFFIATTCLALVFIVYLLYQSTHRIQVTAFGLVLGGALGNLIDRILLGGVTDFINVDFPDFIMDRFPIFNIADSCIFIAVCLLIIDLLFIKDAPQTQSKSEGEEQILPDEYTREI